MYRGLNKVMIIGRLERDPEMRYTPSGSPVTSFSVAVPHVWVSAKGTHHEETEWFSVVVWGDLARFCYDQMDKGMLVYVEGRLKTRSWEDSAHKRHFRTEVVAEKALLLNDSPTEDNQADSSYAASDDEYNF